MISNGKRGVRSCIGGELIYEIKIKGGARKKDRGKGGGPEENWGAREKQIELEGIKILKQKF